MLGFQAAGAAPIVPGHVVEQPETIATAIRIGNPASWTGAGRPRRVRRRHRRVTDGEILAAYRLLARSEGVFVEPASAASVAGLLQVAAAGELEPGQRVVCTVTGNGLKDPDWAISGAPARHHPGRRRRGRRHSACDRHPGPRQRPGDQRQPRPRPSTAPGSPWPLRRPGVRRRADGLGCGRRRRRR